MRTLARRARLAMVGAAILLAWPMLGHVAPTPLPIKEGMPAVRLPHARTTTLDNGLRVFVLEQPGGIPTFTAQLVFSDGGGLYEPPHRRGVADCTAEMLREGTTTRSADELARQLEVLGATLEADAPPDAFESSVTVSALAAHFDRVVDLLADVVRNPAFKDEDLARYTSRKISELALKRSRPEFASQEELLHAIYGNHPAALLAPSAEAVRTMTRQDLERFHATHYHPDNALLVVIGTVKLEQVLPEVQRAFGNWTKRATAAAPVSPAPRPAEHGVHLIDRPGSVQTVIKTGLMSLTRTDSDYLPLAVTNEILGGQTSSRFFQNLRERNGYTYGAYSGFSATRIRGVWEVSTSVRTDVTEGALRELLAELQRIREEPVPVAELENAKRALAGRYIFSLEQPTSLLDNIVTQALYDLPANYWDTYPERLAAVSAADVTRVARRILDPEHLQIAAVGDGAKIRAALAKLGPLQAEGETTSIAPAAAGAARQEFSSEARELFGHTVEQIADRIIAAARDGKAGIDWVNVPLEGPPVQTTNFYDGTAGTAYFLLKAYQARGQERHLAAARRALHFILSKGKKDRHGLYFDATANGVFEGNAGPGYLFLYAHHVTGDKSYLRTAEAIARRIVAVPDVGEKSSPDIISGAAGTGLFLLKMHEITGKALYMDGARRLGDFLVAQAEPRGTGATWKLYGEPDKQPVYYFVGFSHGPAGIGYYLDRLYRASADERYRVAADRAMAHIEAIAIPEHGYVKWYHEELKRATRYSSQWCHGAPGMNPFFLELYGRQREPRYLDWATTGTEYLLNQGVNIRENASVCHGVTGNAASLYQMYHATGDASYFTTIRAAVELLYATMPLGPDGFWPPPDATEDYTYMTGLAGVGDFFVLLYSGGKLNMFGPLGYGDDLSSDSRPMRTSTKQAVSEAPRKAAAAANPGEQRAR